MAAREEEEKLPEKIKIEATAVNGEEEEDDEHDSKERVLLRYFLQEWKLVKSLLDDIVSNGRVVDPSSVQKIRSIVSFFLLFLTLIHLIYPCLWDVLFSVILIVLLPTLFVLYCRWINTRNKVN